MTLRTDSLMQSLPQKGSTMAKKPAPAPAPAPHHQALGGAAHAAMQSLSQSGSQTAVGNEMAFGGFNADREDFTPRSYKSKPNNQG